MTARTKVGVIGGGSWGTAVANVFADAGNDVQIWVRDPAVRDQINQTHQNGKYLKDLKLNEGLKASGDLAKTIDGSDLVVCSVPTQHIRAVFGPYGKSLNQKILINTSKGIEQKTHARVSQIFAEISPSLKYAILSGPSFAKEVVQRLPTAVTVASTDKDCAVAIQLRLVAPYFRAYTSQDVLGVELAGALKNVIAIGSGIVAGLSLGSNAQAAFINRGMAEIFRFGKKLGADALTFLGLAGMGDLILTCTGPLSRNRKVGQLLAEGRPLSEIEKTLGGVAEGVYTVESALALAKKSGMELPIAQEVHNVIYGTSDARKAWANLMGRELKEEW